MYDGLVLVEQRGKNSAKILRERYDGRAGLLEMQNTLHLLTPSFLAILACCEQRQGKLQTLLTGHQ